MKVLNLIVVENDRIKWKRSIPKRQNKPESSPTCKIEDMRLRSIRREKRCWTFDISVQITLDYSKSWNVINRPIFKS